jgi:hypothetical protein
MAKIVLDVDNRNLDTVLTILNNLNPKLIKNISTNNKPVQKVAQEVLEDEFIPSASVSKYSKAAYKSKLKK